MKNYALLILFSVLITELIKPTTLKGVLPPKVDEIEEMIARSAEMLERSNAVIQVANKKVEEKTQEVVESVEETIQVAEEMTEKAEVLEEQTIMMAEDMEAIKEATMEVAQVVQAQTAAMASNKTSGDTIVYDSYGYINLDEIVAQRIEMKMLDVKIKRALAQDSFSEEAADLLRLQNMMRLNSVK